MPAVIRLDVPSEKVLEGLIIDQVILLLNGAFKKCTRSIQVRVGAAAAAAVRTCPEYESVLRGKLREQLGVVNPEPILERVLTNVAEGCLVTNLGARKSHGGVDGGLRIELIKGDYSEVLSAPGASYQSEGGFTVDWLEWLTLAGDSFVVADYGFRANKPDWSRTGGGIMTKPGKWRVPTEFSGTAEDNWLVRAILQIGPEVETILSQEIQRAL